METTMEALMGVLTKTVQRNSGAMAQDFVARAIEAIENDEGFSPHDFSYAAMAITSNPYNANAYLHTKGKEERTTCILNMIEMFKRGLKENKGN